VAPPARRRRGRVVQVDPLKPKLKPPGSKRLKLKCDVLLSNFAFKFNLRRYTGGPPPPARRCAGHALVPHRAGLILVGGT